MTVDYDRFSSILQNFKKAQESSETSETVTGNMAPSPKLLQFRNKMKINTLSPEDISVIAEDVLVHCYGEKAVIQDMIDRVSVVITESLKKIMEQRTKPKEDYPYLISEEELRQLFEEQHQGRDLTKNRKGNYRSPQIAAIWNQHKATARMIEKLLVTKLK